MAVNSARSLSKYDKTGSILKQGAEVNVWTQERKEQGNGENSVMKSFINFTFH